MMNTLKHRLPALLLMAGMGFASVAQATLISRMVGTDEMVYDTDLNITWLKNANTTNGWMDWDSATTWAANLVYGGYDDWRLPTTLQPDNTCSDSFNSGTSYGTQRYGYNCTGSELGHLFYGDINHGLGGVAGQSITTNHNANYNLFSNIQSSFYYSSEYLPLLFIAWIFDADHGYQNIGYKEDPRYAWAVRSGDVFVAAAAVPEPGSLILLGAGLAAWVGGRKRRHG